METTLRPAKIRQIMRYFIIVTVFNISLLNGFSQAPPVTSVGTQSINNDNYLIPILVSGFNNAADISLELNYDNTKLVYNGVTVNPGLASGSLLTTPVSDQTGAFKLSYTSSTPVVLQAPFNTLLTLSFSPKPGVTSVQTPLLWSTSQGDCDITPPAPGVYTPAISSANLTDYFIPGLVNIGPLPAINGPTFVCQGSAGNIYKTDPGMSDYQWIVTGGATITGGLGTDGVSVDWSSGLSQSISVSYFNPASGKTEGPTVLPVNISTTCKLLHIKVFMEGLYAGGGLMNKVQCSTGDQFPGTVADQVIVELHDGMNYSTLIHIANYVNVNTDGTAQIQVPGILNDSYFITVKHRNSVTIISSVPVVLSGPTVNYDFTTSQSQVFGNNLKNLAPGVNAMFSGDTNYDWVIDVMDLSAIQNDVLVFNTGFLTTDLNGDGIVDILDLSLVQNNALLFASPIYP